MNNCTSKILNGIGIYFNVISGNTHLQFNGMDNISFSCYLLEQIQRDPLAKIVTFGTIVLQNGEKSTRIDFELIDSRKICSSQKIIQYRLMILPLNYLISKKIVYCEPIIYIGNLWSSYIAPIATSNLLLLLSLINFFYYLWQENNILKGINKALHFMVITYRGFCSIEARC